MKRAVFLNAEWRKLIMANYPVESSVLKPFLPAYTEPDTWSGITYVSLVGFLFDKVRIKGIAIPFHTRFCEVNLRFYVRFKENKEWKRGVVFISEIVPKPAISWVANTLYKEHYTTRRMKYKWTEDDAGLQVRYEWKHHKQWNHLEVKAGSAPVDMETGSMEEFITEHYWGYSAMGKNRTGEYQVDHPRWQVYPVQHYAIACDFGSLYGAAFAGLSATDPASVLLAEGSPVQIFGKRIISPTAEISGHGF